MKNWDHWSSSISALVNSEHWLAVNTVASSKLDRLGHRPTIGINTGTEFEGNTMQYNLSDKFRLPACTLNVKKKKKNPQSLFPLAFGCVCVSEDGLTLEI